MLLFGFRRSERSLIEAGVALILAVIAVAFPMAWWLRAALGLLIAVISLHLLFSSRMSIGLTSHSKVAISLLAVAVVAGIAWNQLRGQYVKPSVNSEDQPKSLPTQGIVEKPTTISAPVSRSAKTVQTLKSDTADLVQRLRGFQQKIDDWNKTSANTLSQDEKNEKSDKEAHKLFIEHTEEFGASMANLNKEFNLELKPQIILIKQELMSKLPPKSVPPKPTVDYTLNYGISTFPDAAGDIADYLESLAAKLPEK